MKMCFKFAVFLISFKEGAKPPDVFFLLKYAHVFCREKKRRKTKMCYRKNKEKK